MRDNEDESPKMYKALQKGILFKLGFTLNTSDKIIQLLDFCPELFSKQTPFTTALASLLLFI